MKERPIVWLKRPLTQASVAAAIGMKPFEIMKTFIELEVFLAPDNEFRPDLLPALGELLSYDFRFEDDEGGNHVIAPRPRIPRQPPPLQGHESPPRPEQN